MVSFHSGLRHFLRYFFLSFFMVYGLRPFMVYGLRPPYMVYGLRPFTLGYRAYRTYRVRTVPFLSIKREMFRRIMGEKTPAGLRHHTITISFL